MHASKTFCLRKLGKEFNHNFLGDSVGVHHDSSCIWEVSGVLEGTTVQAYLFAHLSDALSIKLGEQVQLKDTFRNVWSGHDVDFE
jgi:hypothetical protein